MEYRFFENGELKDGEVTMALSDAAEMYENGEIMEVRDLLEEIIQAIDEWVIYYQDIKVFLQRYKYGNIKE